MKDETIDFPTIDLIAIADSLEVDKDDPRKSQESISYLLRMLWLGRMRLWRSIFQITQSTVNG